VPESEIKVNLGWEFDENQNWYYPEEYQVGFHDFLMDSPWQVSFAANQSTLAVDVWIVGDTVEEADEWIEVTATPATTPYFLSWPTNPIRLTITEQSIETPKPNSPYTLTPSASTINEGATLTTTVAATNVDSGTTLYWSIAGTGVTAADFSSGALTGSGDVGTDGKFSFAHTAANDLTTEGDETLQIKLFSDSARTIQVGSTASVAIKDSSVLPSVSVVAIANGNEADGSPVVFKFQRTGDISAVLSIGYQLFGTAQAGSDYSGNTTGTVSFAAGSATASVSMPTLADGALMDPGETIIARIDPASGYSITSGHQFAVATITAEGIEVSLKGRILQGRSSGDVRNDNAFAALKADGSVVAWGDTNSGGTAPTGLSGITQIFSNSNAFAALKADGSVVAWGDTRAGGSAPTGLTGVTQLFSNDNAFAALKSDGSVVAWGNTLYGGTAPAGLIAVTQIVSNSYAFAALKTDGSVVAWGADYAGGTAPTGLIGVTQIVSNYNSYAFAALKAMAASLPGVTPTVAALHRQG